MSPQIVSVISEILTVVGAVATICGVLSHLLPGKAGAVIGEIGVDISGFLRELKK